MTVAGSGVLPPTLDVTLTSHPAGVTFGAGGDCALVSPTVARCTTVTGAGSAQVPGTLAFAAAGGSFTATLPYQVPDSIDAADISLAVSLPAGYDDPDPTNNVSGTHHYTRPSPSPSPSPSPTPTPQADVAVDLPQTTAPDGQGGYEVDGNVTGIPSGYTGAATYTVGGPVTLHGSDTPGCVASGATLTRQPAADSTVNFRITATDNTRATTMTVLMQPLAGYDDPAVNTAQSTLLTAWTPPSADVSVTGLGPDPARADPDGHFHLTATVAGFPANSPNGVYTVGGAAHVVGSTTQGCSVSGASLVCQNPVDGPLEVTVTADHPQAETAGVTLTLAALDGYQDPASGNNTSGSVTLTTTSTPPVPVDVALTLPASTDEDGHDPSSNVFTLDGTVTGLPSGVTAVELTQQGTGTLQPGAGCTATDGGLLCAVQGGHVHPVVGYTGASPGTTTLTVATPSGYTDASPATATTTLRPEAADALSVTADLGTSHQQESTLTVTVTGAADGHPLTVAIAPKGNGQGLRFTTTDPAGCQTLSQQSVRCPAGTSTWTFPVHTPSGQFGASVTVADGVHTDATADFGSDVTASPRIALAPASAAVTGSATTSPRTVPHPVHHATSTKPTKRSARTPATTLTGLAEKVTGAVVGPVSGTRGAAKQHGKAHGRQKAKKNHSKQHRHHR